jgi:crotonobetainyl-CoA:carnitine CoA-transferase CaiB-like acyl-CoA transferase
MQPGQLPLAGYNVVDLGRRASTAWCARLLADYGARTTGVEETPHPLRAAPPFDPHDVSVVARYFLANRHVTHEVGALLESAQVVVVDSNAAAGAARAANPEAIVCEITPYGSEHDETPGNDLTACASGGWAFVNGLQGREPLKSSGLQASYQTGTFAFGVIVSALIEQAANAAPGQLIDIAERDVLVSTAAPAPLRWQYSGFVWSRRASIDMNEGPVPVKDGWFALTISRPAFWRKAMHLLGLPDLAEDEELQQAGLRPKLKERFVDRVEAAMATWNRMDLFDALGKERVIAGPVLRMDELAGNPQLNAREFFRTATDGTRYPGPFARYSTIETTRPWFATSSSDSADEERPAAASKPSTRPVRADRGASKGGPLAGFRGLVLTQAWAGTYATQLLGLLGADVIQLETRGRLDSWRGTYQNPIPKVLQDHPDAKHAWNLSPLYNSVNLNKRCVTVDLSEPEGVEIFKTLVQHVDFVAENFSPRVMGNLGISYETLAELKPDLVMASLSAYGAVGPWAHVPGIGGTIEPSSGMSALLGYTDEHPMNSGQMYPDPVAGLCGFSAIAVALLHRDRTGEGQYIDLSMQEANFTFIGDAWMEYELTGEVRGPLGNTHPLHSPHGMFPCAGDDQWIAIAVENDEQWSSLVRAMELDWSSKMDCAARRERASEIAASISETTSHADKHALAASLRRQGLPAAPVLGPDEIAEDESLRERGLMQPVAHPEAGTHVYAGLPAVLSRTPGGITRHAPLQGQHSFEVFETFLGMDEAKYRALCDAGISGTGPSTKASVANQA